VVVGEEAPSQLWQAVGGGACNCVGTAWEEEAARKIPDAWVLVAVPPHLARRRILRNCHNVPKEGDDEDACVGDDGVEE
jgi:hypothetical protein